MDSGLSKFIWKTGKVNCRLGDYLQNCNDGLINLFHKLKDTVIDNNIKRDNVFGKFLRPLRDPLKYDLLSYFPSLSFRDKNYLNYQTIFKDISYLIKTASDIQFAFKEDMKNLLGPQVVTKTRVEVL